MGRSAYELVEALEGLRGFASDRVIEQHDRLVQEPEVEGRREVPRAARPRPVLA